MRPQHITAENASIGTEPCLPIAASMRPQHITAENGHIPGAVEAVLAALQ